MHINPALFIPTTLKKNTQELIWRYPWECHVQDDSLGNRQNVTDFCTETVHALAPHSVRQKIMMISLDVRKSHSDIKNSKEDH